jgi:hypothetical protein
LSLKETQAAHEAWWEQFWNRSHVFLSASKTAGKGIAETAQKVTKGSRVTEATYFC